MEVCERVGKMCRKSSLETLFLDLTIALLFEHGDYLRCLWELVDLHNVLETLQELIRIFGRRIETRENYSVVWARSSESLNIWYKELKSLFLRISYVDSLIIIFQTTLPHHFAEGNWVEWILINDKYLLFRPLLWWLLGDSCYLFSPYTLFKLLPNFFHDRILVLAFLFIILFTILKILKR